MEGRRLGSMEEWRRFFMSAETDIFEVIKNAIILAAMDSPDEFKQRRDRIAELLFSCKLTKCLRCAEVGLTVPEDEDEDDKCKSDMDGRDHSPEDDRMKENKVDVSMDNEDDDDDDRCDVNDAETDLNHHHNHHLSYGEVEALNDEIEEESQMYREVLRIKEILENNKDESDTTLYNSLRRLELMDLSVETLKATEIGKSVKVLVKHGSEQIKRLAGMLLKYWVDKVDQWLNAPDAITNEGTPESMKKSDVVDEEEEEEGLPSPPLDEGAFFITDTAPIEWGEFENFFDGMDDNGNPQNNGESTKSRENGRKPSVKNSNLDRRKQQLSHESVKPSSIEKKQQQQQQQQQQQPPRQSIKPTNDRKPQQLYRESVMKPTDRTGQQPKRGETLEKKQATVVKPNKPSLGESGPGRPAKPSVEQNSNFEFKAQKRPTDRVALQKRELASQQQNKFKNSEEAAELKLEAAKRKLQERYQEAENAKKQRTVQVMELRDIPKQDHVQRNPHMKPGNNNSRFRGGNTRR